MLDKAERIAGEAGDHHVEYFARTVRIRLNLMRANFKDLPPSDVDQLDRVVTKAAHGEYLASISLARACCGEGEAAQELVARAESLTGSAEVTTLTVRTRAVLATDGSQTAATAAFQRRPSPVSETSRSALIGAFLLYWIESRLNLDSTQS